MADGAGLRFQECLDLRVKDLDFDGHAHRADLSRVRILLLPLAIDALLQVLMLASGGLTPGIEEDGVERRGHSGGASSTHRRSSGR